MSISWKRAFIPGSLALLLTRVGHRRRHVCRAGIGVPVLKGTASARAFQRCAPRAYILMAYAVMALDWYEAQRAAAARATCGDLVEEGVHPGEPGAAAALVRDAQDERGPVFWHRFRCGSIFGISSAHADGERRGPASIWRHLQTLRAETLSMLPPDLIQPLGARRRHAPKANLFLPPFSARADGNRRGGQIESEGRVSQGSVSRVLRSPQIDAAP